MYVLFSALILFDLISSRTSLRPLLAYSTKLNSSLIRFLNHSSPRALWLVLFVAVQCKGNSTVIFGCRHATSLSLTLTSDCHFVSGSGAENKNSQFAPSLVYNHLSVLFFLI